MLYSTSKEIIFGTVILKRRVTNHIMKYNELEREF